MVRAPADGADHSHVLHLFLLSFKVYSLYSVFCTYTVQYMKESLLTDYGLLSLSKAPRLSAKVPENKILCQMSKNVRPICLSSGKRSEKMCIKVTEDKVFVHVIASVLPDH